MTKDIICVYSRKLKCRLICRKLWEMRKFQSRQSSCASETLILIFHRFFLSSAQGNMFIKANLIQSVA